MASSSSYPFGDASVAGKSAVHAADNPYEDMIQSCQNDPVGQPTNMIIPQRVLIRHSGSNPSSLYYPSRDS